MQPSLIAREDTMFGVCAGLGEELGVSPLWFRVALALGLFANPPLVIAAYLTLGVALALFRWAFPPHRAQTAPAPVAAPHGDNDDGAATLAEAA